VLVVHTLALPHVDDILSELERRRGWRAARSAVVVCQVDGGATSSPPANATLHSNTTSSPSTIGESTSSEPPAGFRWVGDGERLERGARYFVPTHQRAWFEGTRLRLGSRAAGEHRPLDRLLLSLGEGWGSESVAVVAEPLEEDGECGLRIIHAVGGVAVRWKATATVEQAAASSRADAVDVSSVMASPAPAPERSVSRDARAERVFSIPASGLGAALAVCAAVARRAKASGRIRVWQPGCKTGGLTYAIAMLLKEAVRQGDSPARLLVFGTDSDEQALAVARAGRYPAGGALGMDPELRGRYTFDEGDTIRASETLREVCLFTRHELGDDLPMARMDLIVCQRVFDGLDDHQRAALVDAFHYSLRDGGLLLALDSGGDFPEDRFERLPAGYLRARRAVATSRSLVSSERHAEPASAPASPRTPPLVVDGLEPLAQAIGLPFLSCDEQLRVIFASGEAREAFGLPSVPRGSELASLASYLPGGLDVVAAAQRALEQREPQQLSIRTRQRTYLARIAAPVSSEGSTVTIAFTDVSPLELARARAVAQQHRQAALARLSELALGPCETGELYAEALEQLFGNIPVCAAGIIVERGAAVGSFEVGASRGLGRDPLAVLRRVGDSAALLNEVVARGCVVSQSGDRAAWGGPDESRRGRSRPNRSQSWQSSVARGVGCPILADGSVLGVIALYGRTAGIDDPDHQPFLRAVARVLGGAIQRKRARRRLELELEVSRILASASTLESVGDSVLQALRGALAIDTLELWAANDEANERWVRLWASRAEPSAEPPSWLPALDGPSASEPAPGPVGRLCIPLEPSVQKGMLVLRGAALRQPDPELATGLANIGRLLAAFLGRLEILARSQQRESSFRQKSAELEALYASFPVGVSIHDYRGRVRYLNRHLAQLDHLTEGPAVDLARGVEPATGGHPLNRLYAEEVPTWVARVLELGEPVHDVELSVAEGHDTWHWLCNFAPIRDAEGRLHGASVVVQDITALKRVEANLREADHQKDDFLAILGHELRNPIAAIRSATELLGRVEPASPQLLRLHGVLERQTRQTMKLIDGLLDVARVARGKVELELAPVPLARLVREVVDDRQQQFHERSLERRLPEEELWVQADRARLTQILDNLLSNAIKFTAARGRITITVSCSEQRGSLQVDDDGAGIEPELLPKIFEPFLQGRAKSVGHAGLGVGLALVKGLVELHGFELHATSAGRGRGASFRIEFPIVAAPDSPAPPSRVDTRPLDLLLVEDNVDIAETLAELLAVSGHRVRTSRSAEEALAAVRERRPEVMLCDIGLPGMSGLELASHVRADPELMGIRLVAMTGYGDAATQSHMVRAGFDRTLVKPVQLEALRQCLSRVAAASTGVVR
jgi:signal transduction histidine kinase/CheY-like chemotaxis protein/SAM-dependent methyltransferase